MAKVFITEDQIKEIIKILYKKCYVAGLICELCYLRNFRVGDVRYAKASHFRMDNAHPEIYLCYDKRKTWEWFPIPIDIYNKIQAWIRLNKLQPENHVFDIISKRGRSAGRKGIITHEWIHLMWLDVCKELGLYTSIKRERRRCKKCKYHTKKGKCKVLKGRIKNPSSIDIKHCIRKGKTEIVLENHPKLHESLRGASAQAKIEYYMGHCRNCYKELPGIDKPCPECGLKGYSYGEASLRVFTCSNWKDYKTFRRYIDGAFGKRVGDRMYMESFGDKKLITDREIELIAYEKARLSARINSER